MYGIMFFLGTMYELCLQELFKKLEENKWKKILEGFENERTKKTNK